MESGVLSLRSDIINIEDLARWPSHGGLTWSGAPGFCIIKT